MRYLKFEDVKPIFIMGCQRSGTTMLASQLGATDRAVALPELPFIINLLKVESSGNSQYQAYNELVNHPKFPTLEIKIASEKFFLAWSKNKAIGVIELIVNEYLSSKAIELATSGSITWIEHCPTNIDNFYLLRKFFPNSKFVNIVRDPRAIYSSMKAMARWEVSEPIKLSRIWLRSIGKCYLFFKNYSDVVTQVRYEDYVKDTNVLIELCTFLDINFSIEMASGGGVILPNFTKKQHRLTMNKASIEKISSWKNSISKRESEAIVYLCREWMVELGYIEEDYIAVPPKKSQKRKWFFKGFVFDTWAKVINKLVLKGFIKNV